MKCANAVKLYRKSGEAEGSAVLRTLTGNVFRQDEAICFGTPSRRETEVSSRLSRHAVGPERSVVEGSAVFCT
jgi:hypothetical protein